MLVKKQAMDKLEQQGKNKHEYDSDEDTEVTEVQTKPSYIFRTVNTSRFAWLGRNMGTQSPQIGDGQD